MKEKFPIKNASSDGSVAFDSNYKHEYSPSEAALKLY
jgi:hypothetical protein